MERFYKSFKEELIYRQKFESDLELNEAVNKYVYVWYNHIRPHSYNGGLTPFEARNRYLLFELSVTKMLDHYNPYLAIGPPLAYNNA